MKHSRLHGTAFMLIFFSSYIIFTSCTQKKQNKEQVEPTTTTSEVQVATTTSLPLADSTVIEITNRAVALATSGKLAASLLLFKDTSLLADTRLQSLAKDLSILADSAGIRKIVTGMSDVQYEKIQQTKFLSEPRLNKLFVTRLYKERYKSQDVSAKPKRSHPCLKKHGCTDCAGLFAKFKKATTMDEKIAIDDCHKAACQ